VDARGLELHNAHIMVRNILLWQSSSHFASKTDSCSALSKSTKIDKILLIRRRLRTRVLQITLAFVKHVYVDVYIYLHLRSKF